MRIKGMSIGDAYNVGRLAFWPVHGPEENIGFVDEIKLKDDRGGYGSMGLGTTHPNGGIGPWGMGFFFPSGQDRVLRESIFVRHGETVRAKMVCVEPANAGMWSEEAKDQTVTKMMPASLLAALPAGGGYEALWDSIERRYESMGQKGETVAGLLENYDESHHYPMGDDARGAIVAMDGRVVAVQIAPNVAAFQSWWDTFGLSASFFFESRTMPDLPIPIGDQGEQELSPDQEGMCEITWMDVLRGWIYATNGRILFVSLVDGEGFLQFKEAMKEGQRERQPYSSQEFEERVND